MSKVFTAEYDAKENVFRLEEPPEGVADHEKVKLAMVTPEAVDDPERPWLAFRGCLSKEAGDELAALVEEMFPTEK
jgi:hypothetical protein